jgi:hypothetical protein
MNIVRLWTDKIESGEKKFHEAPAKLKPQIKDLLIAEGHGDLVDE